MDTGFLQGMSRDSLDKFDDWLENVKEYVWKALNGEQGTTNLEKLFVILDKASRDVRDEYRQPTVYYPQIATAAGGRPKRKSRKRGRKSKK